MQYNIIQKKSKIEVLELINELKAELFLLRFKNKTGQQDQTHKIKLVRRDIAKALTALKQLESGKTVIIKTPKANVGKEVAKRVPKEKKDKVVK